MTSHPLRLVLISAFAAAIVGAASAEPVTFARHLALSPDGKTLAFAWAGDIWTVPVTGGDATRLTVHPADDSNPVWSRDGQTIAFASDRHGASNVFRMTRDGKDVTRLTFADRPEIPSDFAPDGQSVLYDARKTGEVMWEDRIYSAPTTVGQSYRIGESMGHEARYSPDGKRIAYDRGASRWWRTGYRGSANWDIWIRDLATGDFTQVTNFGGTDMCPIWDPTGEGVYFLSDREDTHNVWHQQLASGKLTQVTHQKTDRVRDFTVSADGRTLAYTVWNSMYVMSLPDGTPHEITVSATSDSTDNAIDLETLTRDASEIETSPSGDEIAVVVRGEIYVIKTEDDKPTRRVTRSPSRDWQVVWSPDGKTLYFVSDRDGQEDIYRARSAEEPARAFSDSLRFKIERVTDNPETETYPQISPDGKQLSFVRSRGDIIVRDLKSGSEKTLFPGWNEPEVRWSPDSKWIAYAVEDEEYNPDIWIVPADGSADAVNISQHPDADVNPQWSADAQVLAFASAREGFDSDLYMVFLSPDLDEKSSVDKDDYFKKAGEAAGKRKPIENAVASGDIVLGTPEPAASRPAEEAKAEAAKDDEKDKDKDDASIEDRLRTLLKEFLEGPKKDDEKKDKDKKDKDKYEYDLATAYQRIRRVTSLPGDQQSFALAPSGEMLAFSSSHEGDAAVFTTKWNGDDRKKIVSSGVGVLQWTLDGKRLVYLKGGVPGSCTASGGDTKTHKFRGKMEIDHRAETAQKFDDAARRMGLWFYHPTLKDLDWPALSARYRELALSTRTVDEFNEVFSLLLGELNGSHLGIYPPQRRPVDDLGYLGIELDAKHAGPGLRVATITPKSPADRDESRLYPGDVLLEVNGKPVGPDAPLERALINTEGEEIIVKYIPSPNRPKDDQTTKPASQPGEGGTDALQPSPLPGGTTGGSSPSNAKEPDTGEEAAAQPSPLPGGTTGGSSPSTSESSNETGDAKPQELVIRPISYGAWSNLQYDAWVESNRKYVEEHSGGRIGYAHIRGMGEPQFYTFERDLYAAAHGKDGLIIDVRNNGGGWTADWVMAVLEVRRHAYTVGRGGKPGYPQGRLIFYSWVKPATMMCNQYSYSNAEIVSHAFKNLHRGPLVGMTTFGAVISTGAYDLMDGSLIRQPFRGWYTLPDMQDMELHGAEPDVKVPLTPQDEEANRHPQLDAAIKATLEEINK